VPAARAAAAGLGIEVGEVTSGSTRRRCCRTSRPT